MPFAVMGLSSSSSGVNLVVPSVFRITFMPCPAAYRTRWSPLKASMVKAGALWCQSGILGRSGPCAACSGAFEWAWNQDFQATAA